MLAQGAAGGEPVGVDPEPQFRPAPAADGSLTQDPEFTLPTAAGPLSWRMYWNSDNAGQPSEWGSVRAGSFPLRLTFDGTTAIVMAEDGSVNQYVAVGGLFAPSGNNYNTLVQNGDGSWDVTPGLSRQRLQVKECPVTANHGSLRFLFQGKA